MDVTLIETLLREEEQAGPAKAKSDLVEHRERRATLAKELSTVQESINTLQYRFQRLPKLPDMKQIQWAEAIVQFPNAAIVVLDTTGINDDSDIIRILIANLQGEVTHDWHIRPQRYPAAFANTTYTGIQSESLLAAPTIQETWAEITAALAGHYILAYNLKFVRDRLRENALNYDLEPVLLIGECLMERAVNYYSHYQSLKLVDVCSKIGHTLPHPATALDRAKGQAEFLAAMREGILDVTYRPPAPATISSSDLEDDSLGDLDDEPF